MTYSVSPATATTLNEGTGAGNGAVFTFNLTRAAGDASFDTDNVSFKIIQVDGSGNVTAGSTNDFASSNGVGFVPGTGTGAVAAWGAGGLTNTLTITADPDAVVEPTENFQVWIYRNVDPGHPFYTGTITLTNDDASAGPVFSSPSTFALAENTTAVGTVAASGFGTTTYAFHAGGLDNGDFTLDAATGALTFTVAPNFEAPAGSGAGGNAYLVDVDATSGGLTTLQHLTVNVSNVDDVAPVISAGSATANVAENTQAVTLATPLAATTDAASTATTWSITGGTDASAFAIDPATGVLSFVSKPDFEAPTDSDHNNTYQVIVKATDSAGLVSGTQTETITVTNVVEGPVITSNNGGAFAIIHTPEEAAPTTTILTEVATKDDAGVSATFSLSGADAGLMHIDATTGAVNFVTTPDYEFPADSDHDNVYQFTVTAATAGHPSSTQQIFLFVDNVSEPTDPITTAPAGGGTTIPTTPTAPQIYSGTAGSESIAGSAAFNDTIDGHEGSDTLDGGSGNNSIQGGDGDDVVRGFDGTDTIDGGTGNDDVNGNVGNDIVLGGDGGDTVRGGQGDDIVSGGAGDDGHVNGNLGNDIVHGDDGNDTVYGGQGSDTVYGDAGNDQLSGDLGNDVLYGGPGADKFMFAKGGGQDWVGDFNAAEGDHVVLAAGTTYTVSSFSGQVLITLSSGDSIGLAGVAFSSFSSDWVSFA